MRRLVILLAVGTAAAALAAAPGHAAGALCNPAATVELNIGAAAAVPAVKGDRLSTFGAGEARSQAARLTSGGGNICKGTPTAATSRALARVDALLRDGKRTEARAALATLFEKLKKKNKPRFLSTRVPDSVHRATAACPDQSAHISLAGIKGVADNVALATKAQQARDTALADKAMDAARAAFKAWVQTPANKAATVGDWLRVQRAADQIGATQVVTYAAGRARNQAVADVKKAEKVDKCTVSKSDFDCWVRMIATAQLLGLETDVAASREFGKAIEDRIRNIAPEDCEEWTLTSRMTSRMKNNGTEWVIAWAAGKFRVNREAGVLDGSYKAGYVPDGGWPGLIGNATDDCIEESGSGRINHGPAHINGSGFHYRIEGTINGDQIELQTPSDDAKVTVTAPPNIGCQLLAGLGQLVLDVFVKAGIGLTFTATRTQELATFEFGDENGSIKAEIKRTPLVKP